jgi:hypothetical protein
MALSPAASLIDTTPMQCAGYGNGQAAAASGDWNGGGWNQQQASGGYGIARQDSASGGYGQGQYSATTSMSVAPGQLGGGYSTAEAGAAGYKQGGYAQQQQQPAAGGQSIGASWQQGGGYGQGY